MEKNMVGNQENYMEQGLDLKRLVLVLGKKMWLLLVGAILGAVLGGATYKIVTNITNGEPEYRASADYYITFYAEGADYYNAYTWDGILRDDPIVDYHNSVLLDSALISKNIPHKYIQYKTGGHSFGASDIKGTVESRQWKKEFMNWLKVNIK